MPLFMDIHRGVEGLTAEAVAQAHQKDLEVQSRHNVDYKKYWFNAQSGDVFCLVEAPDREPVRRGQRFAEGGHAHARHDVEGGRGV